MNIIVDYLITVPNFYVNVHTLSSLQTNIASLRRYQKFILDRDELGDRKIFYKSLFEKAHIIMIVPNTMDIYGKDYNIIELLQHPADVRNLTYRFDRLINKSLRSGSIDSRTLQMVYNIMNDIENVGDNTPIVLYCGIRNFQPEIGSIYNEFGFMSMTGSVNISIEFTNREDNSCILMFTTSNNQLDMGYISVFPYENEYISYPNMTFIVNNYYNLYDKEIINVYYCTEINIQQSSVVPHEQRQHCSNVLTIRTVKPHLPVTIDVRMDNILNWLVV